MKKGIIFASSIMIWGILSCGKHSTTKEATMHSQQSSASLSKLSGKTTKTTVRCEGNTCTACGTTSECCQEGIIDGDKTYVQCKCSTCEMSVVITTSVAGQNTHSETSLLSNGQVEVLFFHSFLEHIATAHPGLGYDIKEIEIVDDEEDQDIYFITYTYQLSNAATSSVSFLYNRADGTKKKIDCKGTCDCRERYFPSNGSVECTCSPCDMTITTVNSSFPTF